VEVQGTAEGATFSREELSRLVDLAVAAGSEITAAQRRALSEG
jgi:ribonuclease PH